jgi:cytochrome c oxidase assembly protein subunit 15
MKSFLRLSIVGTLGTYLLVFIGGLVRVSGAGLGCPDWPRCFGGWIPPLSLDQLPPDIDPIMFNVALAWIEWLNRLAGMIVGLLIAATAIVALIKFRDLKQIWIPAALAAILVAFQGWQGGMVVLSELNPLSVSLHLIIAIVIVSLLTYMTQQAHYHHLGFPADAGAYPKSLSTTIVVLWVVTFAQVLLGATMRGSVETLVAQRPLANDYELLSLLGGVKYVHLLVGVVVAAMTFQIAYLVFRTDTQQSTLVRYSVWWLSILIVLQLVAGSGLIAVALPPLLQLFHLWIAAIFLGTLIILYTAVNPARKVRES